MSGLAGIRQKIFSVASLKDLLASVENQNIVDFIKETHFYSQLQCLYYSFTVSTHH